MGDMEPFLTYLDFELTIEPGEGRAYPVCLDSPAGEARGAFCLPFDDLQMENALLKLQNALLRSGGSRRKVLSPEQKAVRDFGGALFDALICDEVRTHFDVSLREAERQDKGLRLKLRILPPELIALPWEYLYDRRHDTYLVLSSHTPVVRYLELPRPARSLSVTPPLHVLVAIANPADAVQLDVERERRQIDAALQPLMNRGWVKIDWLSPPTWRALQRALRREEYHIFHFVGHGDFDRLQEEGRLVFEDGQRRADRLPAIKLARLLADHRSLRLAILNACESAYLEGNDPFASMAATLVRAGIPAVVAMQFEITDLAAIEFSQSFYESLVDNLPVDAALAETRKAIDLAVSNTVEWGTPVLYTHAPDGQIFDLSTTPPTRQRPSTSVALKIHQAYIVQSALFYFPSFLEHPEALIEPLRFLAQGDMQALMEREDLGFDWTLLQAQPSYDSPFVRRVGPILDPLAQFTSGLGDDWDTQAGGWLLPPLRAPHSQRGHLPYLVPANWSFRLLNPPDGYPKFHVRPALKLHIFPYGVVDVLLCTEFFSQLGLNVTQFVRLVNGLSHVRQRRGRGAVFEVASANSVGKAHPKLNTSEILVTLADTLNRVLFEREMPPPCREDPLDAPLAIALFLSQTRPLLSPADHAAQIYGLATGKEDWQSIDPEYAKPYARSSYGMLKEDYIRLGRLHSVVQVVQPKHRAGKRELYWSLLSRIQLARVEAFLYTLYGRQLNSLWREHQKDSQKAWEAFKHWLSMKDGYMPNGDLFFFWDDLIQFSSQPQRGHSNVYERAAALAGVEKQRKAFAEEFAAFMRYGLQAEPRLFTAWKRLSPLYKVIQPFLKGGTP
jgi:hypothetical protein